MTLKWRSYWILDLGRNTDTATLSVSVAWKDMTKTHMVLFWHVFSTYCFGLKTLRPIQNKYDRYKLRVTGLVKHLCSSDQISSSDWSYYVTVKQKGSSIPFSRVALECLGAIKETRRGSESTDPNSQYKYIMSNTSLSVQAVSSII